MVSRENMFFAEVYSSWKHLQRYKYERIFRILGRDFFENAGSVLDLGCGTGYLEEFLRKKGIDSNIVGIDSMFAKLAFPFVVGDGNEMPFRNNSFDAVFCIYTM